MALTGTHQHNPFLLTCTSHMCAECVLQSRRCTSTLSVAVCTAQHAGRGVPTSGQRLMVAVLVATVGSMCYCIDIGFTPMRWAIFCADSAWVPVNGSPALGLACISPAFRYGAYTQDCPGAWFSCSLRHLPPLGLPHTHTPVVYIAVCLWVMQVLGVRRAVGNCGATLSVSHH